MKKSLLALAVLGAFAGAASAQSSVTLSGSIDVELFAVGVAKPGGGSEYDYRLGTNSSGRNNFTISGVEDLGGGLRAFFLMQHRFKPNDGTVNTQNPPGIPNANATLFWRQLWVGLGGGFGDVRLGRMLTPTQEFNGNYEVWGTDTIGSVHTGGSARLVRANNQAYYRSPSLGGFKLHASVAESQGQFPTGSTERPAGLGLEYSGGPLSVAVAYDRDDLDEIVIGLYGKFAFGAFTLYAQFEDLEVTPPPLAQREEKRLSVSAGIPFGAMTGKVGFLYSESNVVGDPNNTKVAAGLDYALSKRTTLYTNVAKRQGDNLVTGLGLTDAEEKVQFGVGVWHRF